MFGTLVLEVAAEFGVEWFVNIPTDKAADPVNVLVLTKRIAERLTAHILALYNLDPIPFKLPPRAD